ncbi:MAG: hypothetical protein AAGM46_26100 [Cyanobacteria bacterium J06582_2]
MGPRGRPPPIPSSTETGGTKGQLGIGREGSGREGTNWVGAMEGSRGNQPETEETGIPCDQVIVVVVEDVKTVVQVQAEVVVRG